ncbi:MAG: hypothetical protein WCB04_08075 [Mycobacteriales bacterium]
MNVAEPTHETTHHAAPTDDVPSTDAEDEGYLRHVLAAFVSPAALALAAFTMAASGLMVLLGPLALIPSFSGQSPVGSAKNLAYLGIGVGVVAIALALWSLLRPETGLIWPRYVAGAATIVAMLVIVQYVGVLIMAANSADAGGYLN